jgi:hypothetical protein
MSSAKTFRSLEEQISTSDSDVVIPNLSSMSSPVLLGKCEL